MRELQYYKKAKKSDTHNHLNLSMSYYRYKKWAGFSIPRFPRKLNGLAEMHEIITEYTRPRCQTSRDVLDLIDMSIRSAIHDNIVLLEGSVDMNFIKHFNEDLDTFLFEIASLVKKYKDKITVIPELGIAKTLDREFLKKWTHPLISSGVFKNIDLYGPEVSDEVQHGIGAAGDDKVLQFLADKKIRCNVCPASNVGLGAVKSLKDHPIGKMMRAGVLVSLGTDDLMFFGKTNSLQLYELVKEGVITEKEADVLIASR